LQAIADGRRRKTSRVFDAVETLFLDGGNQAAIADDCGGSVPVIGVDAKNVHG